MANRTASRDNSRLQSQVGLYLAKCMLLRHLMYGLWLSGIALEAALALVVISKKLWGKFPLFASYVMANLIAFIGTFLLRGNAVAYFRFYWTTNSIATGLGLGIAYEIFHTIFAAHPALKRLAKLLLAIAVTVLVGLGGIVILLRMPLNDHSLTSAFLLISEAIRILEVGLIGALFVFSGAFGLKWRQLTFGIALGLGLIATVELVAVTMQSQLGPAGVGLLNLVRIVMFNLSLLIWIGYILAPEPSLNFELPQRSQLEEWNRAVMELIHQ